VLDRRQDIPNVDASIPSMTDRTGNVIPFNAAGVYKDATAKGI
jgi:hypothetical protein